MQDALGSVQFPVPGFYSVPNLLRNPKFIEWSFEIEQPLGAHDMLALTYTGNHGIDRLLTNLDANAYVEAQAFPNRFGGLPFQAPDPRFQEVDQLTNLGTSNYNGFSVQLRHAYRWGLQGQVAIPGVMRRTTGPAR